MLRFTALNEDSDDESEDEEIQESTKEAQEAELFDLYNKALVQQRAGKHDEAQQIYEELLKTTLLAKSSSRTSETKEGLVHPGVVLQYSALKNLAGLAAEKKDYNTAMEYYIKAVDIDCSDVSIWYKMGKLALQVTPTTISQTFI
uniref:Calcineurin-binding protein cabin-1-like n=1 Tax=Saccoglossus kowalevskii TaxID=10224 RepID=A0ABM0M284_SACKO|nr:PREDICTED: calcineurin-binding protein cabin-1-like [Saccoglossus kowalevskii]